MMPAFAPAGAGTTTPIPTHLTVTITVAQFSPRRPTKRASAPRLAAQAATFAAWPPAPLLVTATWSSPGTSGCSSRTITSSRRSPRVVSRIVGSSHGNSSGFRSPTQAVALVRTRRRARRRRCDRDGAPCIDTVPTPTQRARGTCGGRGRPLLPRDRGRGGAALPRGRGRDLDGPVEPDVGVDHEMGRRGHAHAPRSRAAERHVEPCRNAAVDEREHSRGDLV